MRWIGGSACAGKSVLAGRLAGEYGLRVYHCDQLFEAHRRRADPVRHRRFSRLASRPPEELWRPPAAEQARRLRDFYEEEFEMVLEDLRPLAARGPVLAEGSGLLPALVAAIAPEPRRALWLVASPKFRRLTYPRRGTRVRQLLERCRDPEGAYRRWMERDDRFAAWVVSEARRVGKPVLAVDGRRTLEETAADVARQLGLTMSPHSPESDPWPR